MTLENTWDLFGADEDGVEGLYRGDGDVAICSIAILGLTL